MTIEEKAKELYAKTFDPCDSVEDDAERDGAMRGFIQGAEWMQSELIDKAAEWFTNYLGEIGYPDDWLRDSKVQQSGIERFRKAMEE